jgi:hypothetical protein
VPVSFHFKQGGVGYIVPTIKTYIEFFIRIRKHDDFLSFFDF